MKNSHQQVTSVIYHFLFNSINTGKAKFFVFKMIHEKWKIIIEK
jgi:hypothetical protein